MSTAPLLPSWRPGPARDAVVGFLDAAESVAPEERVACFDNDGTLWCERPTYAQFDFFVDAMKSAVGQDPSLGKKPEFAALMGGDSSAIGEIGLARIAVALSGLFEGLSPQEFTARVREFMGRAVNPALGRPLRTNLYQPMLELLAALRERGFMVGLVTGGGTEFVRAVSAELYGVPAEAVVGTLLEYDGGTDDHGRPTLLRSSRLSGVANEGVAKVSHIQAQLGRRPILAAGNSGGDKDMLEWARAGDGPSLALLVDHDDDAREFRYVSSAETFAETEPITDVGTRLGWTVVSMARDWETVFAPLGDA